jgi:hypothetical protein
MSPSFNRTIQIPGKKSQELYDKIAGDIDSLLNRTSISGCKVEKNAAAKSVVIKHSLFSASLACQEEAIQIDVKLSLLASPFRSKLDQGIDKWIAQNFNV